MMEEWHQKLHNNSSPDDLVICQALLDYLAADQDMKVYWSSLAKEGKLHVLMPVCAFAEA
jgi:alpha-glucan,water dikinase